MVNQELLELVNVKVLSKAPPADRKNFGIADIEAIVRILSTVFKACKENHPNATKSARNPNFFQRMRLHRVVANELRGTDASIKKDTIVNMLLDAGKDATDDDIRKILTNAV